MIILNSRSYHLPLQHTLVLVINIVGRDGLSKCRIHSVVKIVDRRYHPKQAGSSIIDPRSHLHLLLQTSSGIYRRMHIANSTLLY
jgi:hypothetical protein